MVELEIAIKGSPALLLPSLLIATYLEKSRLLPPVKKIFRGNAVSGKEIVQLKIENERPLSGGSVIQYLLGLVKHDTSSVCIAESRILLHLQLSYRFKNGSQGAKVSYLLTSSPFENLLMN